MLEAGGWDVPFEGRIPRMLGSRFVGVMAGGGIGRTRLAVRGGFRGWLLASYS